MDTLAIRQELYKYIKEADDDHIEKLYAMVKSDVDDYHWWEDKELIAELNRRSDDLKTGKDKGVEWNDIKDRLMGLRSK